MRKIALGIFAHPDDAEFMCTGTLSLLKKAGWSIHIATMAQGDKGSHEFSRKEISRIRKAEASKSAELLEGHYRCLEFEDVYIFYSRETINKTTGLIREIHPKIVFTASPNDYMIDHEITSLIVQTACFSTGIKNMETKEESFEPIPYLYYCDPMEGKDKFGNLIQPSFYVNIESEMDIKERMLSCHASQRNWLLEHHKIDEYTLFMKRMAEMRGREINTRYAEGFRQHLGHGYPYDNMLKDILGDLVLINHHYQIPVNNILDSQ
jgi:LmbE family N-acetylglucosaminyl deacetylase